MYLLDDQDIDEDLRSIYKARNPLTAKNLTSSPSECDYIVMLENLVEIEFIVHITPNKYKDNRFCCFIYETN